MLKNLNLDLIPPQKPNQNIIPDPWGLPPPTPQTHTDQLWELSQQLTTSIAPPANLTALPKNQAEAKPAQVLLQDWLKLKAEDAKQLSVQLQEALGLLCWIEQGT